MLESAEIGHKISKQVYARKEPHLREALLNAQFDLSQTGRGPLLIILSGVQAAGRGETANKLTEWMDPRHIRVVAFGTRTPEEAERPPAWRYWRALPPKGKIGIFLNAWYNEAMREATRGRGKIDDDRLHSHVQAIREHELMLSDEGHQGIEHVRHGAGRLPQVRFARTRPFPFLSGGNMAVYSLVFSWITEVVVQYNWHGAREDVETLF